MRVCENCEEEYENDCATCPDCGIPTVEVTGSMKAQLEIINQLQRLNSNLAFIVFWLVLNIIVGTIWAVLWWFTVGLPAYKLATWTPPLPESEIEQGAEELLREYEQQSQ